MGGWFGAVYRGNTSVLHRIIYSSNDMSEVVTKRTGDTKENNLSTC